MDPEQPPGGVGRRARERAAAARRPRPTPATPATPARNPAPGGVGGSGVRRPLRRVEVDPDGGLDPDIWPLTIPAVAQLAREGLTLGPATVLVGENGSGKSTLVEAIAAAFGMNPEGGSVNASHSTRQTESPLHQALRLVREPGAPRWGYFLRAETMHGLYTYLESLPDSPDRHLHELSHGESFLDVLGHRFRRPGLYLLDEPESALSFAGCLALVGLLHDLTAAGSQVIVSTHSPVVAALPGAAVLELGEHGFIRTAWEGLQLVAHYRRFLDDPAGSLRHVLEDD